jgi:hypothetical protein
MGRVVMTPGHVVRTCETANLCFAEEALTRGRSVGLGFLM